jgi:hypothetical protein
VAPISGKGRFSVGCYLGNLGQAASRALGLKWSWACGLCPRGSGLTRVLPLSKDV